MHKVIKHWGIIWPKSISFTDTDLTKAVSNNSLVGVAFLSTNIFQIELFSMYLSIEIERVNDLI